MFDLLIPFLLIEYKSLHSGPVKLEVCVCSLFMVLGHVMKRSRVRLTALNTPLVFDEFREAEIAD